MMKFFKWKKWIIILFFFVIYINLQPYLYRYFAVTERVDANVLLVEGWVSRRALYIAGQEFLKNDNYDYIVTTGLEVHDFFPVVINGFLVFFVDSLLESYNIMDYHKIAVVAYGQMGGEHCSHFNFFINDSLITDFCAEEQIKHYEIKFDGKLSDVDSIRIEFDNDALGDFGDHNLYVKEIIVNDTLHIPYKNNALYERTPEKWKKRIPLNYNTYAGFAKNKLITYGVDEDKIIAVQGKHMKSQKTLSSALSFKQWLDTCNIHINGLNIVTDGTHARRTWNTYRKVVNDQNFGIIAIHSKRKSHVWYYNLKEIFANIYYWIVLKM